MCHLGSQQLEPAQWIEIFLHKLGLGMEESSLECQSIKGEAWYQLRNNIL